MAQLAQALPCFFRLWVKDPVYTFVFGYLSIKFSAQQGFPLLFSVKKN
jgi:hypothetical protein